MINSKGGVGKTTLAVHLADWLGIHGWSVKLVDCDAQRLSSRWLKLAQPSLSVSVMNAPQEVAESLPKLQTEFGTVVVDAPGGLSRVTGAILSVADAVCIPTGGSNLDIMGSEWTTSTVREIKELRGGKPQAIIIPVGVSAGRLTTQSLVNQAESLGFAITNNSLPYRQIYAQVAGLVSKDKTIPPRLIWQLGRSRRVRQAAEELDNLFREILPEACKEDPGRVLRLVSPQRKSRREVDAKASQPTAA